MPHGILQVMVGVEGQKLAPRAPFRPATALKKCWRTSWPLRIKKSCNSWGALNTIMIQLPK